MRFMLALSLVVFGLASTEALRCYICNSHTDKDCRDLQPGTQDSYLKDCNSIKENDNTTYTLCRKLHMYLEQDYTKGNQAQDRVHRDCGTIEDSSGQDCYYKSGYNTRTWVCSCDYDECNSASLPASGPVLLASALLGLAAVVMGGRV